MSPTNPRARRLVGVSTKMYFSAARTSTYIHDLLQYLSGDPSLLATLDVFLIPDTVTLTTAVSALSSTPLLVGAQDAFWEDSGAFTGCVSPAVLAEVGATMVEIGHAERRRLFRETDRDVARKAAAAARNGLVPLVCVGERTGGEVGGAVEEVSGQVEAVMRAVPEGCEVILAYEPVWAIGAAEPAGAEHVVAVTRAVRGLECVRGRKGLTRILYGGSAGPGLFEKLKDGVDGLFLGRFAHEPGQFYKTIQEVANA